nr:hypothetical protein [Tanacetum cinerariifolium]
DPFLKSKEFRADDYDVLVAHPASFWHVVSVLPVSPAHAESKLEATVKRLFDEGGSADQGDSGTGGELLASSILNVEYGIKIAATLPFVTSFVSTTPKHESGVPTDSVTGLNLCPIGASERFVISLDSSHHFSTNASGAEDLEASAMAKERALTDLNSLITSVHELETSSFRLQEKVTAYENCMEQLERFQDDQMKVVNDKFDQLWLLAQCMELVIVKYLNSLEYLFALGAAISKAIEKGTKNTSDIVSAAANTTMALSITLAFESTVPPITIEDYKVMGTDGPEDAPGSGQGEVASFPNTVEFEKEELDNTPELSSSLPFLAWERCLHFMHISFLEVANVPVAVSKFVCSFAQCFRDFIWSFPLRSELTSILRMACFIALVDENSLKVLARFLTFSRPAIKASYSASLLVASNLNLRAYVNSIPSRFVIIRKAPEPSMHDDTLVNTIYGSGGASSSSMTVS